MIEFRNKFNVALENDLNTSLALTTIFDVLKSNISNNTKIELLKDFDFVLDLGFADALNNNKINEIPTEHQNINDQLRIKIDALIEKRKAAKQQGDYASADAIRDDLLSMGLELVDTKEGTTYKIKK